MSAYIVDDKTINKILAGIEYTQWKHLDYAPYPRCILDPRSNISFVEEKEIRRVLGSLGEEMREMNEAAVSARYPFEPVDKLPGPRPYAPYEYKAESWPRLVPLYKAIDCYLYQCSEGDTPEKNELYSAFKKWQQRIAAQIVSNLPEYDKAE